MPVHIAEDKIDCVINVLFLKISKIIEDIYIDALDVIECKPLYQNKENIKPICNYVYNSFVNAKKVLIDTLTTIFKRPRWPTETEFKQAITIFLDNLRNPIFVCLRDTFKEIELSCTLDEEVINDQCNTLCNFVDMHSERFNLFNTCFDVDYYISYWKNHTE